MSGIGWLAGSLTGNCSWICRFGEAEVLNHCGTVCLKSGDPKQAWAHHRRALDLARAVGSPLEQAHALDGVGRCALARGDTATAVTELRQALEIYQRIGAAEATQLVTDLAELGGADPIRAVMACLTAATPARGSSWAQRHDEPPLM
jgi:Tfp pilus assembly protein PilF